MRERECPKPKALLWIEGKMAGEHTHTLPGSKRERESCDLQVLSSPMNTESSGVCSSSLLRTRYPEIRPQNWSINCLIPYALHDVMMCNIDNKIIKPWQRIHKKIKKNLSPSCHRYKRQMHMHCLTPEVLVLQCSVVLPSNWGFYLLLVCWYVLKLLL